MATHWNRLNETVLMRGHNKCDETVLMRVHIVCLYGALWKIIPKLSLIPVTPSYLSHCLLCIVVMQTN